jgi:hypothetical protein
MRADLLCRMISEPTPDGTQCSTYSSVLLSILSTLGTQVDASTYNQMFPAGVSLAVSPSTWCCTSCCAAVSGHLVGGVDGTVCTHAVLTGMEHLTVLAVNDRHESCCDLRVVHLVGKLFPSSWLVWWGWGQGSCAPLAFLSAPGASSVQTSVHAVGEPC